MSNSRFRACAGRWLSVLSCGVVGGTLAAALTGATRRAAEWVLSALAPASVVLIALAVAAMAAAVLWSIGRGRWLGLLGVRHLWSYPPLWLAILIGFGMWAILVNGFGDGLPVEVRATSWLVLDSSPFAAAALAVFAAVSWGASWAFARVSRDDAEVNTSRDLASVDFDWILRWVRTDDAIESAGDDQFGHRFVADRMARRIASSDGPSTLALLGERGAGKSTIGNLLAKRLSDHRGLVFVRVSLWPFENSQAAVRGIVDGVVAELSTRVDVVALTEVRQQYIEAIRSAGGRFESIASLLVGRRSAEKQLEAIGQLAIAAGLRVVLWIEDLERFAGSDELPENGKASRDVERLSPVRALLYLLDKSSAITVILATTSLEARFDLDKIARFIERPPQPKNAEVAKLFAVTRKACLGGHPRTIVDSAPVEAREPLSTLESEGQTKAWLFDLSGETNDPAIALCALVASPRSLKNTLRSVVDSWRTLAGEVDFDDLLLAAALREATPEVFATIDDSIVAIRARLKRPLSDKPPEESGVWKRLASAIEGTGRTSVDI